MGVPNAIFFFRVMLDPSAVMASMSVQWRVELDNCPAGQGAGRS
jgi:hypothetical protein